MSFKRRFFKNMIITGSYNYTSQAILFFSTIVTSRLLAPETFGFVGLITVFTGFISIFSDSGISLAVIKSSYKGSFHKAIDNLSLATGILLCFLTCFSAYPISRFFNKEGLFFPVIVMSLIFIIKSMTLVRGAILSQSMKFATIGKVTLLSVIVQVALTIMIAFFKGGYWSLIIPQIFAAIIVLIFYESIVKLGFKIYPLSYVIVALRHTKNTIGNLLGFNVINYWARNSDNLIVGKIYGTGDLGIYNRAYNLLLVPLNLVTGLIGSVLYPSLSKLKNEGGDIQNEYLFVLRFISYLSFPVTFILIEFPYDLVSALWGRNWIGVSELLPYFGLLFFSQSLLSSAGNIMVLQGKERALLISGWIGSAVMISAIVFGAFFSITAIAQSYSLAFILFVLPFNIIYVFINTLKFSSPQILLFWVPVVIFSLALWMAVYFNFPDFKTGILFGFFIIIIIRGKNDLTKILSYLRNRMITIK